MRASCWLWGVLLVCAAARAEQSLIVSAGVQDPYQRVTFLTNRPFPMLGLDVVERQVLTPYTGWDLSLGLAADLTGEARYGCDELPAEWIMEGLRRDRWIGGWQAVRGFVSPLPYLDLGAGFGLNEHLPLRNRNLWGGEEWNRRLDKVHFQWRRHLFVRLDFAPHAPGGPVMEFEHQLALREGRYYGEPLAVYALKLGWRFRS